MAKDYYDILGIARGSSQEEIKDAYRCEVKKCHPDATLSRDTGERFRDVREAYETLGDEDRRRRYDRESMDGMRRFDRPAFRDPWRERRDFRKEPDDFRGRPKTAFDIFINDLFDMHHAAADEYDLTMELTRGEALRGGVYTVTIPVEARCELCAGLFPSFGFSCPRCGGSGRIRLNREFAVRLPGNVPDGTAFRLMVDEPVMNAFYLNIYIAVERN